jgi:nitroreductase
MEFQDVVNHRRMVRTYDTGRDVPPEVVKRLVTNALRAPSAGFSQGTGFLVLETAEDIARFRSAVTPDHHAENWFAAQVQSPLLVVVLSNKETYLDRYAQPDKGHTDRSDSWWPAPYWDIDAGFSALLMLLTAVDEGLGACFFGLPIERIDAFRGAFGIPSDFNPIGVLSFGYSNEPPRDVRDRRRPASDLVRHGRWD